MLAALLSRRLRTWLLMTLLAPVAAKALDEVGERVAERRGEAHRSTRAIRYASRRLRSPRKAPLPVRLATRRMRRR